MLPVPVLGWLALAGHLSLLAMAALLATEACLDLDATYALAVLMTVPNPSYSLTGKHAPRVQQTK